MDNYRIIKTDIEKRTSSLACYKVYLKNIAGEKFEHVDVLTSELVFGKKAKKQYENLIDRPINLQHDEDVVFYVVASRIKKSGKKSNLKSSNRRDFSETVSVNGTVHKKRSKSLNRTQSGVRFKEPTSSSSELQVPDDVKRKEASFSMELVHHFQENVFFCFISLCTLKLFKSKNVGA